MDFEPKKKKEISLWIVGTITVCVIIFLALQNIGTLVSALGWLLDLLSPLILGLALALVFNVPMRFFESKLKLISPRILPQKALRPLAYIVSLLFVFGVIAGVFGLVIPELASALRIIADGAVRFLDTLSTMSAEQIMHLPFGSMLLNINWNKLLITLQDWLKTSGGQLVNSAFGTITSVVGGIVNLIIAFVFSVYILFSKDVLKSQCCRLIRAWLPEESGNWLIHASAVASLNFRNFISGQSLEAVILGILCAIGMAILRLPYAPTVGALVGITALIPVVGAFVGAGVGAFMILTVSPVKALIFLAFLIILQQLEENLIYPKVMGSRVNLPSLWILAAVTIGGSLAGAMGMLLGVPLFSTAYVLLREATAAREDRLHPPASDPASDPPPAPPADENEA